MPSSSPNIFQLIDDSSSIDVINKYLDNNPSSKDEQGVGSRMEYTPLLHYVCSISYQEESYVHDLMYALISRGHDVNAMSSRGITPALAAAHFTSNEYFVLETFLNVCEELGVFPDVNIPNEFNGRVVISELLMQLHSDYRTRAHNQTVIRLVERLIVTFKADPNIQGSDMISALNGAIESPKLLELLFVHGARLHDPFLLCYAMENQLFKSLIVLISSEPVQLKDWPCYDHRMICACIHCLFRHPEIVFDVLKFMIACGFNVDTRVGNDKSTFLHELSQYATVESYHSTLMKFLIDVGANVNAVDKAGNIPLFYAVRSGCIERVQLLVAAGSTIPVRFNVNGRTFSYNGLVSVEAREACVQYIEDTLEAKRIAFHMGFHDRLGADSPVKLLNTDVLSLIYSNLQFERN